MPLYKGKSSSRHTACRTRQMIPLLKTTGMKDHVKVDPVVGS
ncbi:MAG: hypothetical protein ACYTBP_03290 [Planctomycetota bacterium]